ncbi:MAG: heterodisulfide reductase-related iron-sulfur binding cluster [Desulfurococcaceae archaeon]
MERGEVSGEVVYYPGCTSLNMYPGIAKSTLEVLRFLGINAKPPRGVLCCGMPLNLLGIAKEEHVDAMACLNIAKLMGDPDYVVTSCNGCYLTLNRALSSEFFKLRCRVKAKCVHVAEVIWRNRRSLSEKVKADLKKLRVATHVGCHYAHALQGLAVKGEEGENLLEDVALAFNAEVVDYEERHSCCGAPAVKWMGSVMIELSQKKITSIIDSGADVVLTMCPACMLVLDKTQYELKQLEEIEKVVPVLHVSQLTAIALGFDARKVAGIHLHMAAREGSLPSPLV